MTAALATQAFFAPMLIWLGSLLLLAGQLGILHFVETRVVVGILDRKLVTYFIATFGFGALYYYITRFAAPLIAALFPEHSKNAETTASVMLGAWALACTGIAFHYSMDVSKFGGRRLLRFPKSIYESDPIIVRHLWIKLFNVVNFTPHAISHAFPAISSWSLPHRRQNPRAGYSHLDCA
jgi:hypothetical protein